MYYTREHGGVNVPVSHNVTKEEALWVVSALQESLKNAFTAAGIEIVALCHDNKLVTIHGKKGDKITQVCWFLNFVDSNGTVRFYPNMNKAHSAARIFLTASYSLDMPYLQELQ